MLREISVQSAPFYGVNESLAAYIARIMDLVEEGDAATTLFPYEMILAAYICCVLILLKYTPDESSEYAKKILSSYLNNDVTESQFREAIRVRVEHYFQRKRLPDAEEARLLSICLIPEKARKYRLIHKAKLLQRLYESKYILWAAEDDLDLRVIFYKKLNEY